MAFKLGIAPVPSNAASSKLPIISQGRSLVSPTQVPRTPTLREQAAEWTAGVRHRYTSYTGEYTVDSAYNQIWGTERIIKLLYLDFCYVHI